MTSNPFRRSRNRTGVLHRSRKGVTLIEAIIGLVIGAIVMAMAISAVTFSLTVYNRTLAHGQAAQSLQLAVRTIDQMVNSATTPQDVYSSANGVDGTFPSVTDLTHPYCWGNTQPGPGALTSPKDTAIIVAHDYDLEFCGYLNNNASNIPHVYRIYIDTSTCDASTPYGKCTLKIDDLGKDGQNNGVGSNPKPSTLYSLNNVWCDSYCQSAAGSNLACAETVPAPPTGCSTATPPLFNYYRANVPGAEEKMNPVTGDPLLDTNSASIDTSNPIALPLIESIGLSLSVLPDNTTLTAQPGGPGITSVSHMIIHSAGTSLPSGSGAYVVPTTTSLGLMTSYKATATVADAVGTTPTGTVGFAVDGTPYVGCSAQPLNSSGVATCTFPQSVLTPGVTHLVTGTYTPNTTSFVTSSGHTTVNLAIQNAPSGLVIGPSTQTSMSFSWTAPSGPAPASYSLCILGGSCPYTGITSTSYTATGVPNATAAKTYFVEAINSIGTTSSSSNIVQDEVLAYPPTSLSATSTQSTIRLSWTEPSGNPPFQNFVVTRNGTQIYSGTATSFNDTALASDTAYNYVVNAVNNLGMSDTTSTDPQHTVTKLTWGTIPTVPSAGPQLNSFAWNGTGYGGPTGTTGFWQTSTIGWGASTAGPLTITYQLYRYTAGAPSGGWATAASTTSTAFTDNNIEVGAYVGYTASASNIYGTSALAVGTAKTTPTLVNYVSFCNPDNPPTLSYCTNAWQLSDTGHLMSLYGPLAVSGYSTAGYSEQIWQCDSASSNLYTSGCQEPLSYGATGNCTGTGSVGYAVSTGHWCYWGNAVPQAYGWQSPASMTSPYSIPLYYRGLSYYYYFIQSCYYGTCSGSGYQTGTLGQLPAMPG